MKNIKSIFNIYFSRLMVLSIMILTTLVVSAVSLLPKPIVKSTDAYVIEEIGRLYRFYEKRSSNSLLCYKIGSILDDIDENKLALKWYKEAIRVVPDTEDLKKEISNKISGLSNDNAPISRIDVKEIIRNARNGSLKDILYAADILEQNNRMNMSAIYYSRAYKKSRRISYLKKAIERYSWAGKTDQALVNYEILVRKIRCTVKDCLAIVELAEWSGRQDKAIMYLKKAITIKPSKYLEFKLAKKYIEIGDLNTAQIMFENIIKKYPDDSSAKAILADVLAWSGKSKEALEIMKLLPVTLLTDERLLTRASIKGSLNMLDSCIKDIKTITEARQSILKPFLGLHAVNVAIEYLQISKKQSEQDYFYEIGQKFYAKAMSRKRISEDNKIHLYKFRARKLMREKKYKDAKKAYVNWSQLTSSDTECINGLITLNKREKNSGQVYNLLQKQHIAYPKDVTVIRELANTYLAKNNPFRARLLLNRALGNGVNIDDLRDLLIKTYQITGSWKELLPLVYDPSKPVNVAYLSTIITTLKNLRRKPEAAKIILDFLAKDPYNDELIKELKSMATHYPQYYNSFLKNKAKWANNIQQLELASASAALNVNPNNDTLREKRAQMLLWNEEPKKALEDYKILLSKSKNNKQLLNKAIDSAEWAATHEDNLELRRRLALLEPGNATNTLRIANELSYLGNPELAYKRVKSIESNTSLSSVDYNMSAIPILNEVKKFIDSRKAFRRLRKKEFALSKSYTLKDYYNTKRTLSKDIGPVVRTNYSFLHDSSLISDSQFSVYSRFNVHNHQFMEAEITDYSFSDRSSNYRSFKGQEIRLSATKTNVNSTLKVGIDALRNHYDKKTNIYLPFVDYTFRNGNKETTLSFAERPVLDTPEAMRRNITYKHFAVRHFKPINKNNNLTLFFEHDRNSDGIDSNLYGFGWDYILQTAPFRALNYSFYVDDSEPENSDFYYSENYLITHKLSWLGNYTVDLNRNGQRMFFDWDLYWGLNSESESFRGVSVGVEGPIGKKLFWLLRGQAQSSDSNRFVGAKSYNFWHYSLGLEWRGW